MCVVIPAIYFVAYICFALVLWFKLIVVINSVGICMLMTIETCFVDVCFDLFGLLLLGALLGAWFWCDLVRLIVLIMVFFV